MNLLRLVAVIAKTLHEKFSNIMQVIRIPTSSNGFRYIQLLPVHCRYFQFWCSASSYGIAHSSVFDNLFSSSDIPHVSNVSLAIHVWLCVCVCVCVMYLPDRTGCPPFIRWIWKADARKFMIGHWKIRNWSAEGHLKAFRNIPSGS
jgi:hypothetical protein